MLGIAGAGRRNLGWFLTDDCSSHTGVPLVQGLHQLLQALPVALPLSMGHKAGKTAADQLKKSIGPVDAMRLDRLYQLVCGEDSTCTSLRAVLEPLFEIQEADKAQ